MSYNIRKDFYYSLLGKDVAFFDDDEHRTGNLSKYFTSKLMPHISVKNEL